ncbi:MAG: hypothetical protein Tsb0021_01260 [Chlamydiales bacterium]
MSFQSIIKQLSVDYHINTAVGKDLYAFLINDEFKVYIENSPSKQSFIVYGSVGYLPNRSEEKIYKSLLEANYLGVDMDQCTLSIDKKTGNIVLFRWFDEPHTRYQEFIAVFSQFIGHLANWRKKILHFPDEEVKSKSSETIREDIIKP